MIGYFEVHTGAGFNRKTDLFQIKEAQEDKKHRIVIEHIMTLQTRMKKGGSISGSELEIEIIKGKLKLFDGSKLVFWLEEKQRLAKIRLFASKELYEEATRITFPNVKWQFS